MPVNNTWGTIAIAPSSSYQFANATMGDLLIRGNSGAGQKILLGTDADLTKDATIAISTDVVRMTASTVALSNALGEAKLTTSYNKLGLNRATPDAMLHVNGDAIFEDTVTMHSNLVVGSNLIVIGSLDVQTINFNHSNVTLYTSEEIRSNLTVDGFLSASNVASFASNLVVQGTALLSNDTTIMGSATLSNNVVLSSNLNVYGASAFSNTTMTYGVATVSNAMFVTSNLTVLGSLITQSPITNYGVSSFSNAAFVDSNLTVTGVTALSNAANVYGILSASNATFVNSNLTVTGATSLSNATTIYGVQSTSNAAFVDSNLTVTGATALSNATNVYGILSASNAAFVNSNLTVTGVTALSNALNVYGVQSTSNAAFVDSNLTVTGVAALSNAVNVYGVQSTSNAAFVDSNLTVTGVTALSNAVNVYGVQSTSNAAFVSSNLTVTGVTALSNAANVYGVLSASNAAYIGSNLTVIGATVLSNITSIYGVLSASNAAFVNSNLTVTGATALSNAANVYGILSTSNAAFVDSNLTVTGITSLSNTTTVYGPLSASNNATFASNVTIMGELTVRNISYQYSNVTVFSSEEIKSNLQVDTRLIVANPTGSTFLLSSNNWLGVNTDAPQYTLDINGDLNFTGKIYQNGAIFSGWNSNAAGNYINSNAAFKGAASATDVMLLYNPDGAYMPLSFSNSVGKASIYGDYSNIGISQANPRYTLDVNGDINFTGKIYQNGAIFSGWNSNAAGNYINSNAAFKGPSTSTDVMVLYSSLPLSFSNAVGKASIYGGFSNIGINNPSPSNVVDVIGDIRVSSGIYALSNLEAAGSGSASNFYGSLRAPTTGTTFVAAGFNGDVITTGAAWSRALFAENTGVVGRLALIGSGVDAYARTYSGSQQLGNAFEMASLPIKKMDPFLYAPSGDAMLSNVMLQGSMVAVGSSYINGSLTTNQVSASTLQLSLAATNTHSNATLNSSNVTVNQGIGGGTLAYFNNSNTVVNGFAGDAGFCNIHATQNMMCRSSLYAEKYIVSTAAKHQQLWLNSALSTVNLSNNAACDYANTGLDPRTTNLSPLYTNPVFVNASTVALDVNGGAVMNGNVGCGSNMFVGGTIFLGSNYLGTPPSLPRSLAPALVNVQLDAMGDTVTEGSAYVQNMVLVGSNIGVGNLSPSYPIDVSINVGGVSMNCSAKVMASEFSVYSDRRIKKDLLEVDVDAQLDAMLKLKVTEFNYVDPEDKGEGSKIGFIAQQVASVLPSLVTPVAGFIPNIMKSLPITEHIEPTRVTVDASLAGNMDLLAVNAKVKCRVSGLAVIGHVSASDPESCLVTLDLNRAVNELDELFVVGTEVGDFHVLNYEQINAMAICSVQAQQKRIEALEAKLAAMATA